MNSKTTLLTKFFYQNNHLYYQIWLNEVEKGLVFWKEYSSQQEYKQDIKTLSEKLEQNLPILYATPFTSSMLGKVA